MHKNYCRLVLLILLCLGKQAFSQSCSVSVKGNKTKYCAGDLVEFTGSNTPATNVDKYIMEYGDGSRDTNTTGLFAHRYFTAGTYNTKLIVLLLSSGDCQSTGPAITINPNPTCSFVVTSKDTICFRNNQLCFTDQSTQGSVGAAIVKRTYNLSNGFTLTENAPYSPFICYHNVNDVAGHHYTITMEIADVNGCVSTLKLDSVVYLAPLYPRPSFRFTGQLKCTNTLATFTNTTTRDSSDFKSWTWDFGDGQKATSPWTNVKHTYFPPGGSPNLYTEDQFGCIDTAIKNPADTIRFIVVDSILRLTTAANQCFRNNIIRFGNNSINRTSETYTITDLRNNQVVAIYPDDSMHRFLRCGLYNLNLKVIFPDGSCNVNKDTLIQIYGPDASISNDTIKPLMATQCEAHDTVRVISPNPYLSCHSGNLGMKWFWNFNDPFAPPCTTDTKNGLGINMNCRYSVDSIDVKHYYANDGCYRTTLEMIDTVLGCSDRDSFAISLTAPDAGWDSLSNPIRPGLYHDQSSRFICPNTTVTFFFDKLLPSCGYEKLWINYDSACNQDAWELIDTVKRPDRSAHFYGTPCDTTTGWVTVGVIVKNGVDRFGKECYDTAWYHMMLHLDIIKPNFHAVQRPRVNCGPYVFDFIVDDSIQKNLQYAYWDFNLFGPSNVDDTTYQFLVGDSIIKRQTFSYYAPGTYPVYLSLKSVTGTGCFGSFRLDVTVGLFADAGVLSANLCVHDTFTLYSNVLYRNSMTQYWLDPARAAANKERIWWDLGDGKGFSVQGPQPTVKYDKPGTYKLRMIAQDSLGCRDTFSLFGVGQIPMILTVNEVKAKITTVGGNVQYCAPQIIQFKDSSAFVDSFGVYISPNPFPIDTIYWQFGDNTPGSYILNPGHNFTSNGTFRVSLVAISTASGCRDTDYMDVNMNGPVPDFVIEGDTIGCEPFTAHFKNMTVKKLKSYTWLFGDSNNTQRTDTSGADQVFKYNKPGIYHIRLIGSSDVYNPTTGNTKPCFAVFPDTILNIPTRDVYVNPAPQLELIMEDSICPGQEVSLTVEGDTIYKGFAWEYGDGDSVFTNRPDTTSTHTWMNVGPYTVRVTPTTGGASVSCIDTAYKSIYALSVAADFDIDKTKSPLFSFTNKSSPNAITYQWDFGHNGGTSVDKNPSFNYGADLGEFKVCLMSFTKEGCWDSVCKIIIRDTAYVIIPNVFSPGDGNGLNDAFDIRIEGYTYYHLAVYNRWGGKVYDSHQDGIGNDGVNWNGKEDNEGLDCPTGTYYFIFTYKLITEQAQKVVNGSVTLLREEK